MATAPTTTKIMIIRHAEKPPLSGPPFGVTAEGNQDVESLTIEGWQRAGSLACLFAPAHGPLQAPELATPGFLFASESKTGGGSAHACRDDHAARRQIGAEHNDAQEERPGQGRGRGNGLRRHRLDLLAARGHSEPSPTSLSAIKQRSPRCGRDSASTSSGSLTSIRVQALIPSARSRNSCWPATRRTRSRARETQATALALGSALLRGSPDPAVVPDRRVSRLVVGLRRNRSPGPLR